MKKFLNLLCFIYASVLLGQTTVSGVVTNGQNQPVNGAQITISKPYTTLTTNNKGYFETTITLDQNATISCSAIHYETQSKKLDMAQQNTIVNFKLTESFFQMDEVVVSTAFQKLQSQNVIKVTHQTTKSMQQKGATTLIEGVASVPGVTQIATGTSIGKPVIRGLSGNRVLVYSQGIRVENQQFGDEHGLGLNDAGIESVEIIKGPASLLYGSDALGGVLYFNPEKMALPKEWKINFNQKWFSNTHGSHSTLGVKTATEKWSFLARASHNSHADYKIPEGQRITNSRYNESDLKAAIGYKHRQLSSVVRYNWNKLDIGLPYFDTDNQSLSKKTTFPKQAVTNHLWSINNTLSFTKSVLEFNMGYIANLRNEFEDSDVALLNMKLQTVNYDLKYHLPKIKRNGATQIETIIGIQGMSQTNRNFGEELLIPNAKTVDFGILGTTHIEWNKQVLEGGIRFDNRQIDTENHGPLAEPGSFEALNRRFDSWNFSLGYKTHVNKYLLLRVHLASGFRAPNLAELTSNGIHEGTNRYEIGNAHLKNEQNIQTDLNLEYQSKHFELFVNGFYNGISNFIYISPLGIDIEDAPAFEYTQANSRLLGGEVGVHFHPHPLDWLHFESSFETVNGKLQSGAYLPLIPANRWNNTLKAVLNPNKWFTEGYVFANWQTTFAQHNVHSFETPSNEYSLLNFGFGGKVPLGKSFLNLHLNINNMLNTSYIAHLSRLKTEGVPNIGRNFSVGIDWQF